MQLGKADIWRPDLTENDQESFIKEQGYQRQPMPRHLTKVASYLSKANSILPTSILLSSRRPLSFVPDNPDGNTGCIVIQDDDLPLYIIDGQHRVEGIRHAIQEKEKLELVPFPMVVCIIDSVNKYTEISQFHIINSTAKGIRTDLADRLLLMMAQMDQDSTRGGIPAASLWRLRATQLTAMMGKQPRSPWEGRIVAPNSPKRHGIISERSFSTSLKPLLSESSTMAAYGDDHLIDWLTAFWMSIAELMPEAFDDPQNYAVQKTPGVYAYHMVVPRIFSIWLAEGGRGKEGISRILSANPNVSSYFSSTDYWRSGSGEGAGMTGMSGFARLASEIAEALPEAQMPDIGSMLR